MRTPLLLLAPFLFTAAPALAEAEQEIIVTGQGLGSGAGDLAYDVVTIDRQRLTDVASSRLEDVLRDAAGFQQFRRSDSRSANPTSQGATLRGLGGNASSRALVLLDGVPITDPFGGWLSFSAIDPRRLGNVRVTRGGGSGVNGVGALAGTIELSSARPSELDPLAADIAYGTRDAVDASGSALFQSGVGFATVFGSWQQGDGFVPILAEDRGTVDRAAPYRQRSLGARAVIGIGANTELQASTLVFDDRRDRGVDFTANRNDGLDASVRLVGTGAWRWEALAYLQERDFSSQFSSISANRATVTPTLDQYTVPATGIGGRIEIRPPLGEGIELRIGSDARRTSGSTNEYFTYTAGRFTREREAGGRTTTIGGFIDGTIDLSDALTLTGGGRIDYWKIANGRLLETDLATRAPITTSFFADRSGWEPTGRVGIAFKPAGAVTLRSAAYLGWRLPTLNELYRPFRAGADATAANPLLTPERSRGIDGGIDYRPLSNLRLSVTAFWNRLDDAIANVTLGQGPGTFPGAGFVAAGGAYRKRQNVPSVRSQGIEIDADARIGAWRLAASYALVDARVRDVAGTFSLDGRRPAQVPKHHASATLGWIAGFADASVTARYVSDQFEDDSNSRTLQDAFTLDATLSVPVTKGVRIVARGENLTDTTIEATIGSSAANARVVERATPRTFWLGLRLGGS